MIPATTHPTYSQITVCSQLRFQKSNMCSWLAGLLMSTVNDCCLIAHKFVVTCHTNSLGRFIQKDRKPKTLKGEVWDSPRHTASRCYKVCSIIEGIPMKDASVSTRKVIIAKYCSCGAGKAFPGNNGRLNVDSPLWKIF